MTRHESTSPGLRQGMAWSAVSALVLRLGTVAVGIFLARLLSPEEFGIYAIALTVQAVLMTLADFGLSSDLIRSPDHERKAPTVATLGLVTGSCLALIMVLSAGRTAELLDSPDAGPVIAVMSFTLVIAGVGVVPYASLNRNFEQKKLFTASLADFIVGTIVTVVLILSGWGVMALAVSRIVAQLTAVSLQFVLSEERPRFGFDRTLVPQVLRFGLPVAGANLLSWVLLSSDKIVISHLAGPAALGFYFLAFNISNWPMSAIGQVVRSVALPAFSRSGVPRARILADAMAPTWALTFLAGLMLALLAAPVIEIVYGHRWLAAAPILAILGFFGALRTLFDLAVAFLLARGHSAAVLVVQIAWLSILIPALYLATDMFAGAGTASGHLVAAIVIAMPAYCWALARAGASLRLLWQAIWPPVAAGIPTAAATIVAMEWVNGPVLRLLVGGIAGCCVYLLFIGLWLRRRLVVASSLGALAEPIGDEAAPVEPVSLSESVEPHPASAPPTPLHPAHAAGSGPGNGLVEPVADTRQGARL